ncbi:hypothetical protein ACIRSU_17485 [Streptomyces sp. NPDC101160]|uniref:hypothetical protein n=1 Tax=Streptomyces sp. NPDC101160 TaxID=3366118 RepID=UPI0038023A9D
MTDTATTAVASLLAAASTQGLGDTLRIVLLVSMVGGALLVWFLVRGYGKGAEDSEAPEASGASGAEAAGRAGAPAREDAEGGSRAAATRAENGPGDANA